MARRRVRASLRSYGIYRPWDGKRGSVPQLVAFGDRVPARVGVEFGLVLRVQDASGAVLDWRIDHPPFPGRDGKPEPPFVGTFSVKGNDFDFYLGDTVWEPVADKCGPWTMSVSLAGEELASRSFLVE